MPISHFSTLGGTSPAGTDRDSAIAALREAVSNSRPLKRPDGTPDTDGETRLTERINQVGSVASAMVEREAPGAPDAIKDEATIRFAGYLRAADWGDVSKMTLGPKSQEFVV